MKKVNQALAIVLMAAMVLWMVPAASVMAMETGFTGDMRVAESAAKSNLSAVGGFRGGSLRKKAKSSDDNAQKAVANQVVVLYEDGEIPTGNDAAEATESNENKDGAGTDNNRKKAPKKARGNGEAVTGESGDKSGADVGTSGNESGAGASEPVIDEAAAESAQEKIIESAIDGSFSIDDTIVIESADETANDMVVGVVSSENYSAEDLADSLQKADGIKYAEPNYIYTISDIPDWNDKYIKDAWQLGENGVNVKKAPKSAAEDSSSPVVLAVMDTGIDYTHPDLKDRMWTAPAGFSLNGEHGVDWSDKDDDPMDENGHGTHCAGIIAAAADNSEGIAGVAGDSPSVQLMGVRVLDAEGSGYLEDIVRAFKYLIHAKKEGVNIKAVNCSFGAEATSDIFDEVIDQAGQAGILTIAAAGNESSDNDSTNVSPANSKSDYVVVVAATDEDGSLASYSNYGRKNVDIAAPGSNILSSVCYYNYAPYLYDAAGVKATTQVYGEFGGAAVETDEETGEQSVTPVLGTAYDGSDITDVATFGASRMLSILSKDSKGKASLEITDDNPFGVGNNDKSLRWKIEGASAGDQYLLYFPYDKLAGSPYINLTFRPHTGYGDNDGSGELLIGDVKIDDIDSQGTVTYSTSAEETMLGLDLDPTWNSIWQASGMAEALYDRSEVKDLKEGDFGIGFVYEAMDDGDIYVDISSIAISLAGVDEDAFGMYDVYSGTSMATPAATGAAGLIAAADPEIDADTLKATLLSTTSESESLSGQCSTGGRVDFAAYSGEPAAAKPAISSVSADFKAGKVTIKGRGFGDASAVKVFRNVAAEGETGEISIDPADIEVAGGNTITISKAGYDDYDIIGSDIRFEITNGDKKGEGSFYVVKGLKPYDDEFNTDIEEDEFEIWKEGAKKSDEDYDDDDDEEEPENTVLPAGLCYVTAANELFKYDASGNIYILKRYMKSGKVYAQFLGDTAGKALDEYAEEAAKTAEYWEPYTKEDSKNRPFDLMGAPVYLGDVIYELIHVDMVDRDAYLLMGLDVSDTDEEAEQKWRVCYDSLAGLGTKPEQLDFKKIEDATLAAYGGRLYMLGGNAEENYDEATEEYSVEICKDFFSCMPDTNGTEWKYEGQLPEARTNGKAIASNGKLYYFFTNDADGMLDYSIYAYDGTEWTKAAELPKALFSDVNGLTIQFIGDMLLINIDLTDRILCSVGIDSKGIIFAGKSFDGPGDTFRFNTETNKVEPLEYSLWETISDRAVDGTTKDGKYVVEYVKESTGEAIGKSFPIDPAYVKINTEVSGKGSGLVTGGGYYAKGDKSEILIRPDEGSYIYSISTEGLNKDVEKKFGKLTAESLKPITTMYDAQKDASINVKFGRISTKVNLPGKNLTQKVGTRKIKAYTDGTVSTVKWTSSNKKYAKPNSDGTITFTKAGVGKTVTLTASSTEKPEVKASCKVKIVSREAKMFTWNKKKLTSKVKVQIDSPLAKSMTPKSFKVKRSGKKAALSWKKVSKAGGYLVFRKTGSGRFVQIAKMGAGKTKYTDTKVKKGKKYKYLVVSYRNVKGSKAVRISPATAAK